MEHPKLLTEVYRTVHEHEVFLSFNGDDDAVAFIRWWNDRGLNMFAKWTDNERQKDARPSPAKL